MNGYLVLLRGSSDDYPLSLHETWAEADASRRRILDDPKQAQEGMEIDMAWASDLISVSIVTFRGDRPVSIDTENLDDWGDDGDDRDDDPEPAPIFPYAEDTL